MSSTCPEPGESSPTRVIAHRGASGYLPEHTAVTKAYAYALGADFIEQDLVATADGVVVVLHDIYLDDVSDVARVYPERRRDDGRFYVIDFSWVELGALSLRERRRPDGTEPRFPGRFPYDLPLRVCRLEDEIALVSGLNATTGRHVGIYPEIKDPAWHLEGGIDLTALVHAALTANRALISGPVFVQSFDPSSLRRLRDELDTGFALVQLLAREEAVRLERDAEARAGIAEYAVGVGVPFETLIEPRLVDGRAVATALPGRLAEAGLLIHPYTLRRDVAPDGEVGYFAALRLLIHELRVDAIFCDHPDDALAVRERSAA
ncbi:MAG TPA: glycerophosphodiester phosphodiesterase family protein [Gammaproteobacteria bacterium]|nr:glycerophosphodiester phosphodiesterase family protein [Gammaproteobacteria bacterium]